MKIIVNKSGIKKEIINKVIKELYITTNNLKDDIDRFSGELGRNYGLVDAELIKAGNYVRIFLKVNRAFLADNYGTGSLMDITNQGLGSYLTSKYWNPYRSRSDLKITGRKRGEYIDIFGKKNYSKGIYKGQNLEYRKLKQSNGSYVMIKPRKPTHAFEKAIAWYYNDWLPNAVKRAVKNINFSKYINNI